MEILHDDDGRKGHFYIEEGAKIVAQLTYMWSGNKKIIIDHTEVIESLQGKHIGQELVHKAVAFAREKHIKILPLCPFAKVIFDKTPEYEDVLF